MRGLIRTAATAGLALGLMGGAAIVSSASAQHVVTESEAGKLSFDALTAEPAGSYVHEVQYYRHRYYHRRFHRYHRYYR